MTSPALSALKIPTSIPTSWRSGVKKVSAKKPKTTVGIPARTWSAGFRIRRARVLAQEDGRAEAERHRYEAGPERDRERPDDEWLDAEARRLEERRPPPPGEEVDDRDVGEELERGLEERGDDPDRRHDGDERAEGEDALDGGLAPAPAGRPEPDRLRAECDLARRHYRATAASSASSASDSCSSVRGTKRASSAIACDSRM